MISCEKFCNNHLKMVLIKQPSRKLNAVSTPCKNANYACLQDIGLQHTKTQYERNLFHLLLQLFRTVFIFGNIKVPVQQRILENCLINFTILSCSGKLLFTGMTALFRFYKLKSGKCNVHSFCCQQRCKYFQKKKGCTRNSKNLDSTINV